MVNGFDHPTLLTTFVNTLDIEKGVDTLEAWLTEHLGGGNALRAHDVRSARELREALRELFLANNGVAVDVAPARATVEAAARAAAFQLRFAGDELELAPTRGPLGPVLLAVYGAMHDGSWGRLKACRDDACAWAFHDTSRSRTRTWCSMQVCGNREKARSFRARQH
jgi:predicted RNA-binding Zn ribbon-like protein